MPRAQLRRALRVITSYSIHYTKLYDEEFRRVVDLNLVSTFNIARLAAARMSENEPDENGERGGAQRVLADPRP